MVTAQTKLLFQLVLTLASIKIQVFKKLLLFGDQKTKIKKKKKKKRKCMGLFGNNNKYNTHKK